MTEVGPPRRNRSAERHRTSPAESDLSDRPGRALAAAYEETYVAIAALLDGITDHGLTTVVPACPAWTVRDLVAHMTGVAADAVSARFPLVNPHGPWAERQPVVDAFTAGHVSDDRRDLTIDEVRAEWARQAPVLIEMLRGAQPFPAGSIPIIDWMVVCDVSAQTRTCAVP